MAKKKLLRFEELNSFPNVIQPGDKYPLNDHALKGNWSRQYFRNSHNVVLEVGCGKGEYTLAQARSHVNSNFIGIDIKGDRIWRGAAEALADRLHNVAFLRIQAQRLAYYFAPNEVSEIWLTFPDPQPQKSRERKRLTSPDFLDIYRKVLHPNGSIHLKTDNQQLYDYTMQVVQNLEHRLHYSTNDLYSQNDARVEFLKQHRTYYENIYLKMDIRIKYLRFSLRPT